MSRKQLTSKQLAFLEFLAEHVRKTRVWPTYREIVEIFGYRSPNSVTQNLQALERKGYLVKDENGYRLVGQHGPVGGLPVHGTITNGDFEASLTAEEVTFRDLFPGLADVQAIRLEVPVRGLDVDAGDYLLVENKAGNAHMAVVMVDGEAAVGRVTSQNGTVRVHYPDGTSVSLDDSRPVRILGRYAGHVNKSGLYRSPRESYSLSSVAG